MMLMLLVMAKDAAVVVIIIMIKKPGKNLEMEKNKLEIFIQDNENI